MKERRFDFWAGEGDDTPILSRVIYEHDWTDERDWVRPHEGNREATGGRYWRNKRDYSYVSTLSHVELAWEFLRRNPSYRAHYLCYRRARGRATASFTPPGHPIRLQAEAWVERIAIRFGLAREWYPTDYQWHFCPVFAGQTKRANEADRRTDVRKKRADKPTGRRANVRDVYNTYLRILDALLEKRGRQEILDALYPGIPKDLAIQQFKNHRRAALRLMRGGYLALARRP